MSSNLTFNRPPLPSMHTAFAPSASPRTGRSGNRTNVVKRARWDVSSPTPSPPILSVPLPPTASTTYNPFALASNSSAFQFKTTKPFAQSKSQRSHRRRGHSLSSPMANPRFAGSPTLTFEEDHEDDGFNAHDPFTRRNAAFSRLRQSTGIQGELFVDKMREWERKENEAVTRSQGETCGSNSGHNSMSRNRGRSGLRPLSFSGSASSASGSDGSSSRKRSYWSVIEDEEDVDIDRDATEMDWEVVLGSATASSKSGNRAELFTQSASAPCGVTDIEADTSFPCSSSSSQHGDAENSDEDDDDDDLVFVLNNPAQDMSSSGHLYSSTPSLSPCTSIISACSPHSAQSMSNVFPASADRMLSDLTFAMDAGVGSLDGDNCSDFIDVGLGRELGSRGGLGFHIESHGPDHMLDDKVRGIDAGALWE